MRRWLASLLAVAAVGCSGGGTTNIYTSSPTPPGATPTPTPRTFTGVWEDFKLEYTNAVTYDLGPLVVESDGSFGVDGSAATGYLVVTGTISPSGTVSLTLNGATTTPLAACSMSAACFTFNFCSAVYPAGTFATTGTPCNNAGSVLQVVSMDRP